jgi:hypothetical protein
MPRLSTDLAAVLALVAMLALVLTVPGAICFCGGDGTAGDDCCGDPAPTHDCASTCVTVCCAHPPFLPISVHSGLPAEPPGEWAADPAVASLETAAFAPPAPPPRA